MSYFDRRDYENQSGAKVPTETEAIYHVDGPDKMRYVYLREAERTFRWIKHRDELLASLGYVSCSRCGEGIQIPLGKEWKYCPNCGAHEKRNDKE